MSKESCRIKSYATSANVGPGFDCLGLAWTMANTIYFELSDKLLIEGCDEKYANEQNLSYVAYIRTLSSKGITPKPIHIVFEETEIPVSRGLGSSSSLIVAGVKAANELFELEMSGEEMLAVATDVEGHPDNVAPCIFGGFTCSISEADKISVASYKVSDKLHFAALIPDYELSTELARAVLPKMYSRADVVYSTSHIALLIKAMEEGDKELLSIALKDKIHEPYRGDLIKNFKAIKDTGLLSCISGAGSTMLFIDDKPFDDEIKEILSPFGQFKELELLGPL